MSVSPADGVHFSMNKAQVKNDVVSLELEILPGTVQDIEGQRSLEDALEDVLDTRPTLQLGSSFRRRGHTAGGSIRGSPRRRSLHYHNRPSWNRGGVRRSSSNPELNQLTELQSATLDIEELEDHHGFSSTNLRKSKRRLRERIELHRECVKPKAAEQSAWENFKDVKWPKFKSRLRVLLSYELWKGHMKEVEGHFGTAVVSYFIFLRWLFFMNLVIFVFWFGFVVVPQLHWEVVNSPSRSESRLACVFESSLNYSCKENEAKVVYRNCEAPKTDQFEVRECGAEINENGTLIATRERSSDPIEVTANCSDADAERFMICSDDIDPYTPWYEHIFDFVLGQGVFNETILFHGWYTNGTVVDDTYDLPVAFLSLTVFVFAVSLILLVYKMGHAYNESYVEFGSKRRVNFCNKVFTAWDFNITDPDTAKLKRVHIRTEFEEELADHEKRTDGRSVKENVITVLVRICTNIFTILVLVAAASIIFYAAQYGLNNRSSDALSLEGLVLPIVITAFNIILPFLFKFLARVERFKTQSGEIKMTLLRAIIVRLSSLVVLIITLFILIECTQTSQKFETEKGERLDDEDDDDECEFDPFSFIRDPFNTTFNGTNAIGEFVERENCPVCWETFFGQEFYKLGLINFIVSAASTLFVEAVRNFVSRIKWKGIGAKIGKGTFNIPKSILDLIYTQTLLWLGFMFCPVLPAIILLTTVMLFYVKKYSLIYNLKADKRGTFRSARTNFLFLLLMLLCLFLVFIPVAYSVARIHPSFDCGPFRSRQFMYTRISDLVDSVDICAVREILDFLGSAGFVAPIIVLLLLICYAQFVTLRARKARFELIKKQLILEGANVAHIVGKLDRVLQQIADQRELYHQTANPQDHLHDRIQQIRKESMQGMLEENM